MNTFFYAQPAKVQKRKLSVNFDKNVFKCWVCKYSGKDVKILIRDHIGGFIDWDIKRLINSPGILLKEVFYNQQEKEVEEKETFFPENFIQ